MLMRQMLVAATVASLFGGVALAQDGEPLPEVVAPYVNAATIAVIQIDITRADVGPAFDAMAAMLEESGFAASEIPMEARAITEATTATLGRAGAKQLFLVFGMQNLVAPRPPLIIVPTDQDTRVGDVIRQLSVLMPIVQGDSGERAQEVDGAVIATASDLLRVMQKITPMPRPDLGSALAAADGHTIAIAAAVPAPLWNVMAGGMQQLPPPLNEEPIETLSDGMQWVALGINPPPKAKFTLTIQSKNDDAARDLARFIFRGFRAVQKQMDAAPPPSERLAAERQRMLAAISGILPRAKGDQVRTDLDADAFDKLLREALLPAYVQSRRLAEAHVFAMNMRGVLTAVMIYANDRDGAVADTLLEMLEATGGSARSLQYPRRGEESAMVYVRPPGKLSAIRDPARTILIYEKHDEWPESRGLIVGFADGHVEQIESEAEFKQLLKAAN